MSNSIVKKEEPIVLSKVTRRDVLDEVKFVIQQLRESGNLHRARAALTSLETITDTAGLGRAALLHGMFGWYNEAHAEEEGGEGFFSAIGMTDTDKVTYAKRLINLWDQIERKAIPTDIQKRSVKELIPIANALGQNFELDEADWAEIRMAPNVAEIGRILNRIKKTKPRSNKMDLVLATDGSIYAYVGNERRYVGYLNLQDEDDEIVQRAHTRITDNSPIRRAH